MRTQPENILPEQVKSQKCYTFYGLILEVLYILLQLQKVKCKMHGSKKYGIRTDLLHQKQYFLLSANKFYILQL